VLARTAVKPTATIWLGRLPILVSLRIQLIASSYRRALT